ncbi:SDR family oxidoreductase [Paenibacillus sp.]|uniref:SDR family oxidoreductase n=1 Tax=Paenibacillus sp. TaxID=58172 RepID=UPI002D248D40|nr:SDR family oxidoreductase [Paenibacillus sp.]HZG85663.1 SDR family oxidoreductase [Paenibacillus sp.]
MKILVTGATGQLGAKVVETLLETVPAERIAASVRSPEKAQALRDRGVDVRQGDFDDPASLDAAFAGIDKILIVSTQGDNDTRIRQHQAAVDAAKRAGVKFIAYTSVSHADTSSLFLAPVHKATEEAIRATGIPYSFLRNNWYIENEIGSIQGALAGAPIVTSAGAGRVGWASRDDYARAAAAVLAGEGHENTIYELAGAPATTEDFAAALSRALGREVPVQHVDDATYGTIMAGAGVPDFVVPILVAIQSAIREGTLDVSSGDFAKLLGRPPASLEEALPSIVAGVKAAGTQ